MKPGDQGVDGFPSRSNVQHIANSRSSTLLGRFLIFAYRQAIGLKSFRGIALISEVRSRIQDLPAIRDLMVKMFGISSIPGTRMKLRKPYP